MTDGTLAVRRRDPKTSETTALEAKQSALASGTYEYFAEMETIFGTGHIKKKGKDLPAVVGAADEVKIESRRREKLKAFDRYLKAFKYSAALDSGIQKVSNLWSALLAVHHFGDQSLTFKQNVRPSITFALIQELIHRDGLRVALSGRDDVTLEPVLTFLLKHIADPRFGEMASQVAGVVIGQFASYSFSHSRGCWADTRKISTRLYWASRRYWTK